jgi:hypothetical protein
MTKLFCLLAAFVLLSGCATKSIPVQNMLVNREEFLATQFPVSRLQPDVKKVLESVGATGGRFKSARLTSKQRSEEDGVTKTAEATMLFVDAGHGIFQTQTEVSRNGQAYRVNNILSFMGLQWLIAQAGFHAERASSVGAEVKEIRRLDAGIARPAVGVDYTIDTSSGTLSQTSGFRVSRETCRMTESRPASSIHSKLPGTASILACVAYDASLSRPVSRRTLALLDDLGFVVILDYASVNTKAVNEYTDVAITR